MIALFFKSIILILPQDVEIVPLLVSPAQVEREDKVDELAITFGCGNMIESDFS